MVEAVKICPRGRQEFAYPAYLITNGIGIIWKEYSTTSKKALMILNP